MAQGGVMLSELRKLRNHMDWADDAMLDALASAPQVPTEALRELAHVLGSEENWLARLEARPAHAPIWPMADLAELTRLVRELQVAYGRYLDALSEADTHRIVSYTNTAGIRFESSVRDILHHVFLHSQYHRGKVNLMLRQAGITPVPVDYIGFVRQFPTAVTRVGDTAGA